MTTLTIEPDALERARAARLDVLAAQDSFRAAVREAHPAGMSIRAIAAATGLSHGRIHQLLKNSRAA